MNFSELFQQEDNIYTNGSSYYVLTEKAEYFNICVEIGTFKSKFISNTDLKKFTSIPFNKTNMKMIIEKFDILKEINYDDKEFDDNNYIIYKTKIIRINNWINLLNFIADKI